MKKQLLCLSMILVIPWSSGCDTGGYPADLTYPLRDDLLVIKPPEKQNEPHPVLPGKLDESIAAFAGDGMTLDPQKIPAAQRGELEKALQAVFGTPANPKVALPADHPEGSSVAEAVTALKLTTKAEADTEPDLTKGSRLYRRHCLHCHGLAGDGRGPTGPWVSPPPRDYRRGEFKFVSTKFFPGRKPGRADLLRTLRQGVHDTSMPSFALLPDHELESLVSYVIHLSLRGEVEYITMQAILENTGLEEDSVASHVNFWTSLVLTQRWLESNGNALKPEQQPDYFDDPDSEAFKAAVTEGYKLFTDPKGAASCIACHTDFGRQVGYRYDMWGTLVRPMNLTRGVFRGGHRPIDIYWRIRNGIVPSAMPNIAADVSDDKIWALVAFVKTLPHRDLLPEDVRNQIYGGILTARSEK